MSRATLRLASHCDFYQSVTLWPDGPPDSYLSFSLSPSSAIALLLSCPFVTPPILPLGLWSLSFFQLCQINHTLGKGGGCLSSAEMAPFCTWSEFIMMKACNAAHGGSLTHEPYLHGEPLLTLVLSKTTHLCTLSVY